MLTSPTEDRVDRPVVLYYDPSLENNTTRIDVSHPRGAALRIQYYVNKAGMLQREMVDLSLFGHRKEIQIDIFDKEVGCSVDVKHTVESALLYAKNCFKYISPQAGEFTIYGQIVPKGK